MRSKFVFLALAVAALAVADDTSGTEDEFSKESSLKVYFPSGLFSQSLEHSEALFGRPSYGASVNGIVVATNETGCTSLPSTVAGSIVLIDRRSPPACHFTRIVKTAEAAGALAVLIDTPGCGETSCAGQTCGNSCPTVLPFMSDDGTGSEITIPSMLVWKSDADKIRRCLTGAEQTCNNGGAGSSVSVELRWNMPINEGGVQKVAIDFFSSSDDGRAVALKQALEPVMRALGSRVKFVPHYYIYDGTKLGCTTVRNCGSQCTNKGRYCEPDPDQHFGTDLEGLHVVTENLRQASIWQVYKDTDEARWWDYVNEFYTRCSKPSPKQFNKACAEAAMAAVSVDVDMVNAKMNQPSYGPDDDLTNAVLEDEMKLTSDLAIVALPTVIVNGLILRGSVSMPTIFNAVCHGYAPTEDKPAPAVCACVPLDGPVVEAELKQCIAQGGPTSDNPSGNNPSGVSPGAVVGIFVAFLAVVAIAGFAYYHFIQRRIREEFHSFLSEYVPLDDINESGTSRQGDVRVPGGASSEASGDAQI